MLALIACTGSNPMSNLETDIKVLARARSFSGKEKLFFFAKPGKCRTSAHIGGPNLLTWYGIYHQTEQEGREIMMQIALRKE
jgi:hypothetical protein